MINKRSLRRNPMIEWLMKFLMLFLSRCSSGRAGGTVYPQAAPVLSGFWFPRSSCRLERQRSETSLVDWTGRLYNSRSWRSHRTCISGDHPHGNFPSLSLILNWELCSTKSLPYLFSVHSSSLTHSLARSLAHSLAHSLTHSLTHSLIHCPTLLPNGFSNLFIFWSVP